MDYSRGNPIAFALGVSARTSSPLACKKARGETGITRYPTPRITVGVFGLSSKAPKGALAIIIRLVLYHVFYLSSTVGMTFTAASASAAGTNRSGSGVQTNLNTCRDTSGWLCRVYEVGALLPLCVKVSVTPLL